MTRMSHFKEGEPNTVTPMRSFPVGIKDRVTRRHLQLRDGEKNPAAQIRGPRYATSLAQCAE